MVKNKKGVFKHCPWELGFAKGGCGKDEKVVERDVVHVEGLVLEDQPLDKTVLENKKDGFICIDGSSDWVGE